MCSCVVSDAVFLYNTYETHLKERNDLAIPGTSADYIPKEDEPMSPDFEDARDIYGFLEREERAQLEREESAQHEAASMAAMKRFKKDGDDCRPAKRQRSHAIPIPNQSVDAWPAFIFIPPGQGLFAALAPKLCPTNLHPEISFKYLKACTSMEADMSHVKDFVSIHLPTATFYVGATVRSPEERWVLKADDRSRPSHCDVYSDMYVLLSGHAASIAEREVALIRFFMQAKQGSKCVNKRAHAGGYSRDHDKAFLYLCRSTGRTCVTSHAIWKRARDFDTVAGFLRDP